MNKSLLTFGGVIFMGACAPPPAPIEVVETTIAQVQDAIMSGQTTCRMVVQSYLDRIEAYDQPTGMNAITVVNPNALARADEIDEAVGNEDALGSLFCAPLLIKDNYDTYDLPTTGGSIALKESIPPDDAFMVQKLREADAIVLAKTNMAEWAFSPRQTVSSSPTGRPQTRTRSIGYRLARVEGPRREWPRASASPEWELTRGTRSADRRPTSRCSGSVLRSASRAVTGSSLSHSSRISPALWPARLRTRRASSTSWQVTIPRTLIRRPAVDERADDYTVFLDAQGLAGAQG